MPAATPIPPNRISPKHSLLTNVTYPRGVLTAQLDGQKEVGRVTVAGAEVPLSGR